MSETAPEAGNDVSDVPSGDEIQGVTAGEQVRDSLAEPGDPQDAADPDLS